MDIQKPQLQTENSTDSRYGPLSFNAANAEVKEWAAEIDNFLRLSQYPDDIDRNILQKTTVFISKSQHWY